MKDQNMPLKESAGANAAPLGLFAFGICTILLNLFNTGFIEMDAMILSTGLFYGGLGQIIVGLLEGKKGNTFGLVAFTSYGFFWITFVGLMVMPDMGLMAPVTAGSMVAYLSIWGAFTCFLFIATFKLNRALQVIFATLILLFLLLTIGQATSSPGVTRFGGYVGLLCGTSAIYTAIAILLNELFDRELLPIGPIT